MSKHKKGRHHSHVGSEHYAGMDQRRAEEHRDSMMISEDHSAIANMPQHVVMKEYPRDTFFGGEHLDDTIRGIDHQMGMDHGKMREHFKPKKV